MNCRVVFVSLALLFSGSAALAQDYVLAADGYYYSGGRAYTRTWYAGSSYCGRNGCYYSTPGYYTYTAVAVPVAVTTNTTTNNYPPVGWRTEIIKAHEAKAEAIAYEAALQTLTGFTGYGSGYGNTLQLSTQGVNGQTVYGFNSIASLYGDTSISTLFQQANRLAETQQQLSGEAVGQFNSLVDAHGDRLARSAAILAKGQVLAQVAASLEGPSASKTTVTVTPTPLSQPDTAPPPLAKPADSTADWTRSAQKCFACHSGAQKKGGFDVTAYPAMTQEQRLNVIGRLTTRDDKARMPKNADGTAGNRLGANEIRAWLNVGG